LSTELGDPSRYEGTIVKNQFQL